MAFLKPKAAPKAHQRRSTPMLTSRKRNSITAAGLATAMTLSMCLLSGCNGARFLMGGDPQQATPNTPGQPVTAANTPGAMVKISASAMVGGKPMANAKMSVVDALTGTVLTPSAGVIAAGGGNYQVSAIDPMISIAPLHDIVQYFGTFVYGGLAFTGLSYNFSVPETVFTRPIRYVFSNGKESVSTLSFGAKSLNGTSSNFVASESTSAAGQYSFALLKLAASVNESQRAEILNGMVTDLNGLSSKFDVAMSPATAFAIATASEVNGKIQDTQVLTKAVNDSKLTNDVNLTVNKNVKTVAEKAGSAALSQLSNSDALDFAGAGVKVEVKDGKLQLTNTETGEVTEVDISNSNTDNNNPDTSAGSEDEITAEDTKTDADGNVVSSGSFNPTITLTRGTSPKLSISVSQPAGTEDIAAIFTRVMKSGNTFNLSDIPNATGTATVAGVAKTLELVQDSSAPSSATLPPRFASTVVNDVLWKGYLQTQSGHVKVASFVVYQTSTAYYLVTKFALNDAVTLSSGHTTVIDTNAVTLGASSQAEISLVSRRGEYVDTTK
jgi:hypothetical protein